MWNSGRERVEGALVAPGQDSSYNNVLAVPISHALVEKLRMFPLRYKTDALPISYEKPQSFLFRISPCKEDPFSFF